MSQPRRRRRRGRRGRGGSGQGQAQPREQAGQAKQPQQQAQAGPDGARKRRRRRRGSGSGRPTDSIPSPKASEDLFGLLTKGAPPETLMTEPDGTDLDEVIGELQSTWGVPQYPQEYRITIRVADKERAPAGNGSSTAPEDRSADRSSGDRGPKREKAPSPARLAAQTGTEGEGGGGGTRRRRRRGRRRGGSGAPNQGNGGGGS